MNSLEKKDGTIPGGDIQVQCHKHSSAMSYRMQEPCNPEGWQTVAGGRSGAETPGRQAVGLHPGEMPEFCDPSRVGRDYRVDDPGVSLRSTPGYCLASLQLAQQWSPAELSLQWTRRLGGVCISPSLATRH